jgi:hypothetical protein
LRESRTGGQATSSLLEIETQLEGARRSTGCPRKRALTRWLRVELNSRPGLARWCIDEHPEGALIDSERAGQGCLHPGRALGAGEQRVDEGW